MINLETTYGGIALKNPLIAASSGLTNSLEKIRELEAAGVAAIVLKSLFEEQIENHSQKLSLKSEYPEAADYINTYVKMNHMDKYLNLIRSVKSESDLPIIASINCYKATGWIEFAKTIQEAGADGLELNLFQLNVGDAKDTTSEEAYINIVRELKRVVDMPVVIKMAKNISNLPGLIVRLKALGADGVVLFNRFNQLDIDINRMEIIPGSVFSKPSDFSDTLRWTAIVSGRVSDFDLTCSYGVHSWEDVIKGVLAGAVSVQLCSLLYEQGTQIVGSMLSSIKEWMIQNNYSTIEEFRGKLNYLNIDNPSLYERVQFMKYFSNY